MDEGVPAESRFRRLLDRARGLPALELQGRMRALQDSIDRLQDDLGRVHRELEEVNGHAGRSEIAAIQAAEMARAVYDEEPANRRRLQALRKTEDYELAFTEADPLVSFLIPTYNSFETLRDVALPSILGQDYPNLEVVVVGDCAPPETERAIAEVGDPRVVYRNRTVRGPYPNDPGRRWYVVGTLPYDEALVHANGRWIAGLGDDDEVRPDHTRKLVAAAQANRFEHCYGLQQVNFQRGEPMLLGAFPPVLGRWGMQGAIYHAGLRFFEMELADEIYREPNDWSLCRRMLRAGVSFGMIDDVVVDKHETRRDSAEAWEEGSVPIVE